MRFINTRSRAKEVVKHTNNGKCCSQAQEQMQMRFIKTRSRAKEVAKHTNNVN
jgi:ribosomal 50S subunit-recycling heat shock protein